ncbi:MAG: hydrogenase small subunit [Bacillota bacterium]|nr:hydrogenase small subunit [Bacillota bacterium]
MDSITEKMFSDAKDIIEKNSEKKLKGIWLEASGCSGNIISFLNCENPDLMYALTSLMDLKYSNTLMADEGEAAYEKFLLTLNDDFVLIVDGAISTIEDGRYNIIANYNGKRITALEAALLAGEKAKYIIAAGICASFGGISAASPNPSGSKSISEVLKRAVINLPGCPCHPDWIIGVLAHIVDFGSIPDLDELNRPVMIYGSTIHDNCTRRGYFEKKIFAKKLGEKGCMFKLGCRGPVTKADCPRRKWNGYVNWPIGNNTPCIGCAQPNFPDKMEPFVRY